MLLWIFRAFFFLVILAVVFVNLTSPDADRTNFTVIIVSGLILGSASLLIEIFTPKKSLAALAGVFFALVVGIFISWALSPILDMLNDIYKFCRSGCN